jgi:5'-AMP-activated protein kinase regulatory gamma subunit
MAHTGTHAIKELLAQTSVNSLHTPKGEVITVSSKETPYDAFKKLISHNILSAPVWDTNTNKYTGFLDMRDLVSFVVFIDDDQKSEVPNNLNDILIKGSKLLKVPLEGVTCTYLSRRNTFIPVQSSDNLLKVCEILAKGVHRVPVVNEKGEVINIVSQSSVITFLNKHVHDFKEEFGKTIHDLGLGTKPVIAVPKDIPTIETFRLMDNKKISGVAVVDEHGKLVGNTSASDLKLFLKTPSIELLQMPIITFLNKIRQESIDIHTPTITCKSKDTVALAIGKISSTKVHRLFIADDEVGYKPNACLSITDILRYIVKN